MFFPPVMDEPCSKGYTRRPAKLCQTALVKPWFDCRPQPTHTAADRRKRPVWNSASVSRCCCFQPSVDRIRLATAWRSRCERRRDGAHLPPTLPAALATIPLSLAHRPPCSQPHHAGVLLGPYQVVYTAMGAAISTPAGGTGDLGKPGGQPLARLSCEPHWSSVAGAAGKPRYISRGWSRLSEVVRGGADTTRGCSTQSTRIITSSQPLLYPTPRQVRRRPAAPAASQP
jgi:hypothetical protein